MVTALLASAGFLALLGIALIVLEIRRRHMEQWIASYLLSAGERRAPRPGEAVHLILCVADHYEPKWNHASAELAGERVRRWQEDYPRLFAGFRDADGRPPQHTFFFPLEEYEPEHVDRLARLCQAGYGEVEVHLHHDGDTAAALREKLLQFKENLANRHRLLARDRNSDKLAYGFIHGNWALDNSRPDGRWCGVNNELDVLRETGCYADFTLPSAPSPTQTRKINSIYYAVDDPLRPKSHDTGMDAGGGRRIPPSALMLIQGPLVLDWSRRKWGLLPRLENACIQANQEPSAARLRLWLSARIQVPDRPDWFFVKLHTHGAKEANQAVLLGEPMVRFHRSLRELATQNPDFHYHYVTAREMFNLVRAAESGWKGSLADARDFQLLSNLRPALVAETAKAASDQ